MLIQCHERVFTWHFESLMQFNMKLSICDRSWHLADMMRRGKQQLVRLEPGEDTFSSLKPGWGGEAVDFDSPIYENYNS